WGNGGCAGGEGRGRARAQEPAPAERTAHRLFASGNAHGEPPRSRQFLDLVLWVDEAAMVAQIAALDSLDGADLCQRSRQLARAGFVARSARQRLPVFSPHVGPFAFPRPTISFLRPPSSNSRRCPRAPSASSARRRWSVRTAVAARQAERGSSAAPASRCG